MSSISGVHSSPLPEVIQRCPTCAKPMAESQFKVAAFGDYERFERLWRCQPCGTTVKHEPILRSLVLPYYFQLEPEYVMNMPAKSMEFLSRAPHEGLTDMKTVTWATDIGKFRPPFPPTKKQYAIYDQLGWDPANSLRKYCSVCGEVFGSKCHVGMHNRQHFDAVMNILNAFTGVTEETKRKWIEDVQQ